MEERKYQTEAIRFLSNTKRGILEAPAGAGKTYVTVCALSRCLDSREGIASVEIMVNTRAFRVLVPRPGSTAGEPSPFPQASILEHN
jgi:superfamily II DNA or RNA helicase